MADDQQQKLFRLPGTIEEEECEIQQQRTSRAESPLLAQRNNVTILPNIPRNVTLLRVSTQSSSIGGINRQDSTRSRFRAGPTRKLRRRAVLKSGECNVLQSRISRRSIRFLQDIFTTLVDTQWRWTLSCFALSFVLSWLTFAGIWWLIAFTHGDFDPRHYQEDSNWKPCVQELHSFTSCFLFSIETQHTIGYGGRATTEECPEAIFIMCVQSISGVMIQAFMVGIVFAKMSRPKQRTQTLLFSRNAVICQRDGELSFMFRVGDMRKSHIIGATVRAQLIRSRTTKEGEILPHHQHELALGADGQTESIFFIWPCTVVHKINSESPLYNMSAEDMLTERFEIVVILEGTIESTGQTTQARSSYLPQEILWGHRFEPMVSYSKERQGYQVDYSLFNNTLQVDTPLCSGRELTEFYRLQEELRNQTSPGFLIDEDITPLSGESMVQRFQTANCCRQCQQPHQYQANLEDTLRNSNCYSDCIGPPPYNRPLPKIDINEEEIKSKLCVARYPIDEVERLPSRSLNGSRRALCLNKNVVRSCQDLQPRSLDASKKYLLLTLERSESNGEICNSCSSERFERAVIARRHTGSKELLNALRNSSESFKDVNDTRENKRRSSKELQEIIVHPLQEVQKSKENVRPIRTKRKSYEHAQLQDVVNCSTGCYSSSDTSYGTGSSSESEVVSAQRLKEQEQQVLLPMYTTV